MRRAALTLLLAASITGAVAPLGAATAATAAPGAAHTPAHQRSVRSAQAVTTLRQRIQRAFRHSSASVVDWRFDVQGMGSFRGHSARMSAPASNNKLFVAQTALDRLGPDFRFATPVGMTGTLDTGTHVLHGWLVVRGSGDPLLADANLVDLAAQIREYGIRRVTGGLVVDDHRYLHRTTAPGWHAGFTPYESGPIDAFSVDGNEWNRSRNYIAHTGVANGRRFVSLLRKHGVRIVPRVHIGRYGDATTVATEQSDPLSVLVAYMLVHSYNFEAEMLLDELGAAVHGQGRRTAGLAVVRAEGRRLHSLVGKIYDGSGLSYSDRESPDRIVRWLQTTATTPNGGVVRAGLPVACETGTLEHRLCGRWTRGRVFAKTGTLSNVTALSGYTTTRSGRHVTFSVLVSGARDLTKAEARVDAAVGAVAFFGR